MAPKRAAVFPPTFLIELCSSAIEPSICANKHTERSNFFYVIDEVALFCVFLVFFKHELAKPIPESKSCLCQMANRPLFTDNILVKLKFLLVTVVDVSASGKFVWSWIWTKRQMLLYILNYKDIIYYTILVKVPRYFSVRWKNSEMFSREIHWSALSLNICGIYVA